MSLLIWLIGQYMQARLGMRTQLAAVAGLPAPIGR